MLWIISASLPPNVVWSCGTSAITQTTAHTRLVMIDSVSTTLRIIQRR